ncbi:TetR/AcrR family transcriptional regulator [Salana multivorans]
MTQGEGMSDGVEPAASRRRYHHGDLRRTLLDAGGILLEREGPEAMSLRALARDAGVSPTAPYNHFPSKQALLVALAVEGAHALAAEQARAAAESPLGVERLVALGRSYVVFALEHPQRYRLMFGTAIGDWHAHPEMAAAKPGTFAPIHEALTATLGLAEPDPHLETVAITAWSLAHGLALLLLDGSLDHEGGSDAAPELVERVVRSFAERLEHPWA